MVAIKARYERRVAMLLPAAARGEDENARRIARLVIGFSFTLAVASLLYGVIYAALGMHLPLIGALGSSFVLLFTPWLQRRYDSIVLGAHLVSAAGYGGLVLVVTPMGGLAAPALSWFALVPVAALMLGGKPVGRLWTALALAAVGTYFVLKVFGLSPASEVSARWTPVVTAAVQAGFTASVVALAWLYETNKDLMMGRLQKANAALTAARDEARRAHDEARLVLDNVGDGLVLADRAGRLRGVHSRAAETLLGPIEEGCSLWELFSGAPRGARELLEMGWQEVFADLLPVEVTLDQLPKRCPIGERTLSLQYVPVAAEGQLQQVLVVVADVTSSVKAQAVESERAEQLEVLRLITRDAPFVTRSLRELGRLVGEVQDVGLPWAERLRSLHTLKGNAALVGLVSLASHCHALEEELRDARQVTLRPEQEQRLREAWDAARARLEPLRGLLREGAIVVERTEYEQALRALLPCSAVVHEQMRRWAWEPLEVQLERLSQQAKSLAQRLSKGDISVVIEREPVWLDPERWAPFWSAIVHVLRNAIDHGIEASNERVAKGKPAQGRLTLRARYDGRGLRVEVEDDGRGVDWDRVRERARELGLPADTPAALEAALFTDGLSTRDEVTEISGRGVGMAAVVAATQALGGRVTVASERGRGTCVSFQFNVERHSMAA